MRETFARRVAVLLLLMLLIAVITSRTGPYRGAFAAVLDQVGPDNSEALLALDADGSLLTRIMFSIEEARFDHTGELGPRVIAATP
jgi:hypothetical protein